MVDAFIEKISLAAETNKSRVILALDKTSELTGLITPQSISEKAIQIAELVASQIAAIKINYPLVLASGTQIINQLRNQFQVPIIADFKIADIDDSQSSSIICNIHSISTMSKHTHRIL